MSHQPKHSHTGNCWHRADRCAKCGEGVLCDVCHKHDEPRGDCETCNRCSRCDEAAKSEAALLAAESEPWSAADGSCCALQAVLDRSGWQPGEPRLPTLCAILGVDSFWLHRFMMGFDRNHQIKFTSGDDGDHTETLDEVSGLGIKIAREFVKTK